MFIVTENWPWIFYQVDVFGAIGEMPPEKVVDKAGKSMLNFQHVP